MAEIRVLVAYSSKNRSTAELASWIGEALRAEGLHADVAPTWEVREDLSHYDAVVLGSAVYFGRWRREAIRFARLHRHRLWRVPVWLFSTGPLDPSATDGDVPPPPQAARLAKRLGAEEHRTFGGRLTDGAGGFLADRLLKEKVGGDFRDERQVRDWGAAIAARLRSEREPI